MRRAIHAFRAALRIAIADLGRRHHTTNRYL